MSSRTFFSFFLSLVACAICLIAAQASIETAIPRHVAPRSSEGVIRIWIVGSPYREEPQRAVPSDIQNRAKGLGYTIELTNFPASGFSAQFAQAFREHNEPEILTFDNGGILFGINAPNLPHIEGILNENGVASSLILEQESLASLQPRGWVYLLRTAASYEAARALALQPGVCSQQFGGKAEPPANGELQSASDLAVAAARAYMSCDIASLTAMSDPQKLSTKCLYPDESSQVERVEMCSISGNENVAFAFVGSAFSAQASAPYPYVPYRPWSPNAQIGHQTLLTIVRKQGGKWRLLAISGDVLNRDQQTRLRTEHISGLLSSNPDGSATVPPQIITPDGTYPKREGNHFGDLIWKPSASPEVIAEVAEFVMTSRRGPREPTRLFLVNPSAGKLSTGQLFGGGRFQWRVWSINKNGEIAFSDPRSYTYP
jgi:hypothetical protein